MTSQESVCASTQSYKLNRKREERMKINGIRIGLAFGGAVNGLYRKLPHMNQQLKRDISMLHGVDESTASAETYFANYKEYMEAMCTYPLGRYDIALPGGKARCIDIEQTLHMILAHHVHFEELCSENMLKFDGSTTRSNPDSLRIRFSCDDAQADKTKSVITLSLTLMGFGNLINSPTFNLPVAHIVGSESDKVMMRTKLGPVYMEIMNLKDEVIRFELPNGVKYYAKIKLYHVYDLKYAYSCLGHFGWASSFYPHLFCTCKHLTCSKKYIDDVARNGQTPTCKRLTNKQYQEAVRNAKCIFDEIEKELACATPENRSQTYRERITEENYGITHDGAFPDLLDIDTIMAEPLHCYLGLSTQHIIWLRHLRRQYNISEANFYQRFFSVMKQYAPFVRNQICDESRTPSFIGRICNIFWDTVKQYGAKKIMKKLFSSAASGTDVKDTIKMFDKFQLIREEIACTWPTQRQIDDFKKNVSTWYTLACDTMFTAKGEETVYAHILANIIPNDMQKWFDESQLGYGFFSMQGAEHLNKVTKGLLHGHTNNHFDKPRVHGAHDNDSFVTILRLSRWRFFVQHHKVHVTKLKREEKNKKLALLCYEHDNLQVFINDD